MSYLSVFYKWIFIDDIIPQHIFSILFSQTEKRKKEKKRKKKRKKKKKTSLNISFLGFHISLYTLIGHPFFLFVFGLLVFPFQNEGLFSIFLSFFLSHRWDFLL